MFSVPKINKNKNDTDTMSIEDQNRGVKPEIIKKLDIESPLPEKDIKNKLVFSEKDVLNKSVNSKKIVKNKKDPGAPKKPRSAYLLWSVDERAKLKEQEEFSKLSVCDISKELGKRWNTLIPETKEIYVERSKVEKIEYKQNMENYKPDAEFLNLSNKSTGKFKKIKDDNAPKKPATAFFRWSAVQREELKNELGHLSVTEKSKELGRRWGVLPAEQKQIYQDEYEQEKREYDIKIQNYKPSEEFLRLQDENLSLRLKEQNKIKWKSVAEQKIIDKVEPYFKFTFSSWHKAIVNLAKDHPDVSKIGPLDIEQCLHEMWEDKVQKGNNTSKVKHKVSVDKNKPRKPLNAFQLFCEVLIPALKEDNSELCLLSTADIREIAFDNWKGMTELHRAKFIEQEEAEKERYRKEIEEYQKVVNKLQTSQKS